MNPSIVRFQSSTVQIDLIPDSRGYVLFSMSKSGRENTSLPPPSLNELTCEYLVDVLDVTVRAMQWIIANCEDVTFEGRHLYYQFKEVPGALPRKS